MTWVIAVTMMVVLLIAVGPSLYLWWPTRHEEDSRANLGVNLMTGAIIALSVAVIQILSDARLNRIQHQQQRQSERQSLQVALVAQRDFTSLKLEGLDLRGLYLYNKVLAKAVFENVNLEGANLSKSDLSYAVFSDGTNLKEADLLGVRTPSGPLQAEFAQLQGAILFGAVLPGARLKGSHLENVDLTQAKLMGADLIEAELDSLTTLGVTDLSGARLNRATLIGVDLTGAIFTKDTKLAGALYDSRTRWPKGYGQAACPPGSGTCRVGG